MFKKLSLVLFLVLLMSVSVYAEGMTIFEESDNVEEAAEKLLNGEDVPVLDLLKYSQTSNGKLARALIYTEKVYSQLNTVEKDIYDAIDENYETVMDGTSSVAFNTYYTVGTGYDYSTTEGYDSILNDLRAYAATDLGYNLARGLYALTAYDKPQCFWIDISKTSVSLGVYRTSYKSETGEIMIRLTFKPSSSYTNYYFADYSNEDEVRADYNNMLAKADEIIATFPENATDFQKCYIINNWLLDNNSYGNTSSKFATIAPSALLYGTDEDTDKHPVCEGYAEAFKIICDRAGIDCVCGEAFGDSDGDGVLDDGHKWNLVKLDGKWYYYDGTWNDSGNYTTISRRIRLFLIGTTSMAKIDATQTNKYYHDLDKAQLGFSLPATPVSTDYVEDFGVVYPSSLDFYSDSNVDKKDIASALKQIANGSIKIDINKDGNYNILDAVKFMKLMFK
ncbi:MAG: transglutaminase domain-containing protein [Lachnospirales bacterium]